MTHEAFHLEAVKILCDEFATAAPDAAVETAVESKSRRLLESQEQEWRIILVSDLVPDGAMSVHRTEGREALDEFRQELRFIASALRRERGLVA